MAISGSKKRKLCSPARRRNNKEKKEEPISGGRISEDCYQEILIRLPVKCVLKCKSVCKSWYSLISNPSFAKFHFQQSKNNSGTSLLLGLVEDKNSEYIHAIDYDSIESSISCIFFEEDNAFKRRCPFRSDIESVILLGSSNGLIFLSIYGRGKYLLCVWNPATGEYKKIPRSTNTYYHRNVCIYGLGYDGKNDDYKLVIGICFDKEGLSTLVEVFSLRSNSWETIQTPYNFNYDKRNSGQFVHGNLHWLAKGVSGLCIVYLDVSKDPPSFKEIQLPEIPTLDFITVSESEDEELDFISDSESEAEELDFITVSASEERCLYVIANIGDSDGFRRAEIGDFGRVEVWEMQVYGVHESWTKRYVITDNTITRSVMFKEVRFDNVWSFKNGKIVYMNPGNVVVYDPKHESVTKRKLKRFANLISEVNYSESLVSVNSGTYAGKERIAETTEDHIRMFYHSPCM